MTPWVEAVAGWLVEVYALSTVLLAAAALAMRGSRQPARRLAVARATLAALLLLAPITAGVRWARTKDATPPDAFEACSCANPPTTTAPAGARPVGSMILLVGFGLGATAMVGRLALGAIASSRLGARGVEAPDRLRAILAKVMGQGGCPPRLIVGPGVPHPIAFGLIRPTILLPSRFAESEPDDRVEGAMAHEWAHIRNGDLRWLAVSRLLLPLLFAHPLHAWLRRRIRDDQEALADAEAAGRGGRIAYAEALLGWARSGEGRLPDAFAPSLGLGGRSSSLAGRLALLLDRDFLVEPTTPRRWRLGAGVIAGAAVVGLGLASAHAPAAANPAHVHAPRDLESMLSAPHALESTFNSVVLCCPDATPTPAPSRPGRRR